MTLLDEKLAHLSQMLRKHRQLQVLNDTSSSAALHKVFCNMSRPEKKAEAERVACELVECTERMRGVHLRPRKRVFSHLPLLFLPKHILGQIIYTLADTDVHRLLQGSRAVFHFGLVIVAVRKRREADLLRANAQLDWQRQLQLSTRRSLDDTVAGLRLLTRADMQELRATNTASPEVHVVVYSACILLGTAQFSSAQRSLPRRAGARRSVGGRVGRPASPTRPLGPPSRSGTPLPGNRPQSRSGTPLAGNRPPSRSGTSPLAGDVSIVSNSLDRHSRSVLSLTTDARAGLQGRVDMQFAWSVARARVHDSAAFLTGIINVAEHSDDIALERLRMVRELWSATSFGEALLHTVSKSVRAIGLWLCALLNHDVAVAPLHMAVRLDQSILTLQALLARVRVPDDPWAVLSHCPAVSASCTDFYSPSEDNLIYFPP